MILAAFAARSALTSSSSELALLKRSEASLEAENASCVRFIFELWTAMSFERLNADSTFSFLSRFAAKSLRGRDVQSIVDAGRLDAVRDELGNDRLKLGEKRALALVMGLEASLQHRLRLGLGRQLGFEGIHILLAEAFACAARGLGRCGRRRGGRRGGCVGHVGAAFRWGGG